MNINSFRFHMTEGLVLTNEERHNIITRLIEFESHFVSSMIVMEECAELQQAMIDGLNPNDGDAPDHILEELADVYIGICYLGAIYKIPTPFTSYQMKIKRPICRRDVTTACRKLSVLQQAISKSVRKHDNWKVNLERRVKEVCVEIAYLKRVYHISDEEFFAAVDVKLNRGRIRTANLQGVVI